MGGDLEQYLRRTIDSGLEKNHRFLDDEKLHRFGCAWPVGDRPNLEEDLDEGWTYRGIVLESYDRSSTITEYGQRNPGMRALGVLLCREGSIPHRYMQMRHERIREERTRCLTSDHPFETSGPDPLPQG